MTYEIVSLDTLVNTPDPRQNPLRYLGPQVRILWELLDAIALPVDWQGWRVIGRVESAILREYPSLRSEVWNSDRTTRQLREWGVMDRHGVYLLAGLTDRQQQVVEMTYKENLLPIEIADRLEWPPVRVRVHLHNAHERLKRLAVA